MGADHHQGSASYEQRQNRLRAEPANDEARGKARQDEAQRAPQPHFAESRAPLLMPLTAPVSASGRIVAQLAASNRPAASICQNPSAAHSSRKEAREAQASAIRIGRRPPARSAAKLMAGVNKMRAKGAVASRMEIWSALRSCQCSQTGK